MVNSKIILGINTFHADSSACLLIDGKLIAAIEEERVNRIKHYAGFPKPQFIPIKYSYLPLDEKLKLTVDEFKSDIDDLIYHYEYLIILITSIAAYKTLVNDEQNINIELQEKTIEIKEHIEKLISLL